MDCVEVLLLCKCCDPLLVLASSLLCKHSLLNICLCIPYALSEEFCELCSVLCLFPCISLECLSYFRISLSVSLTAHSKIHSHL